jgi:hypothetical protein
VVSAAIGQGKQTLALLKSLVIGMGVLILLGVVAVAYGIYGKMDRRPDAAGPASLKPFGDIVVPGPGCAIADVRPDGDRLYMRLGPTGPCARVVVVDLAAGRVLGTVSVAP